MYKRRMKNAELEIRKMSEKAQEFYCGTDPLEVTYWEDENDEKLFTVNFHDGYKKVDLTFDELECYFEDYLDEERRLDEEEEEEGVCKRGS